MLSNQALRLNAAARACVGLTVAVALSACASRGAGSETPVTAPRTVMSTESGPEEPALTATEAAVTAQPADSVNAPPPEIDRSVVNPTAPTSYTVKRGDTLWDISSMFLRDPWLWPEIWQVNPQVQNPHLIYPGDELALVYGTDGRPGIRLVRGGAARLDPLLRSAELDGAIATIPYSAIAAFLERPSLISKDQALAAPRVLAFRDERMAGGAGVEAYIRGLDGGQQNARYSVIHVGDAIRDPDDGDVLGYQGIYTATAVLRTPGDPAKTVLTDSARETLEGDRLLNIENEVPLNFVPRAPSRDLRGQIISVVDGVDLIGQFKVVAINRGRRHGLEPGHVLAIDEAGAVVRDRSGKRVRGLKSSRAFAPKVKLPDERSGTMLVFRTFDRMSYGLIVGASSPIRIADVVRTP
jgi:LysM repeat protein